jgi:hypothetical protein
MLADVRQAAQTGQSDRAKLLALALVRRNPGK